MWRFAFWAFVPGRDARRSIARGAPPVPGGHVLPQTEEAGLSHTRSVEACPPPAVVGYCRNFITV